MSHDTGTLHVPRIRAIGPGPFVTFRSYKLDGRHIIWRAREHRKGLRLKARALENRPVPFWQTRAYNRYTGLFFAIGSLLFMLGCVLALIPAATAPPAFVTNITFFAGSIPFTIAGYLQHFQSANAEAFAPGPAPRLPDRHISLIGWQPDSAGWISTFAQALGTIAFNFNTFDAIVAPGGWHAQDLAVWAPGMIGSVLFLISGYLSFIETSRSFWSWHPKNLAWRIVFINLLGCILFMIASTLAYVPKGPEAWWIVDVSNIHLFLGSLCFFIGALLSIRESALAED